MGAITTAVVTAGAAVYGANKQSSAAKSAARTQAQGVASAQEATEAATSRGRNALMGIAEPQEPMPLQYTPEVQAQIQQLESQIASAQQQSAQQPSSRGVGIQATSSRGGMPSAVSSGIARSFGVPGSDENIQGLQSQLSSLQSQGVAPPAGEPQILGYGDPRENFLAGIQAQTQLTEQGYGQAEQTLSPIAAMAQPYLNEQQNLLGLGGQDAYQQAVGRVADPLQAEQERAFMRNNAALGGVGGNTLSALAEQTRARTESNIGSRLGQLSAASSPSLSALQNISNMRLNQGQQLGGIFGGAGQNLASMEENRRRALANLEVGQGSQMAQLAQNYGTAAAGGQAYAAQNAPALSQGIMAGLSAYSGAGGNFGQTTPVYNTGSQTDFATGAQSSPLLNRSKF